jgi:hypothetical protein
LVDFQADELSAVIVFTGFNENLVDELTVGLPFLDGISASRDPSTGTSGLISMRIQGGVKEGLVFRGQRIHGSRAFSFH